MDSDPMKQAQERTNHFGEAMREARKKANVRLVDVASHLDVSLPYLSDVERGRRDPLSNDRIMKVAKFLETDQVSLLEAAARDRGKVVIHVNVSDSNAKVRAAALLSTNWLRMPRDLIERILQVFSK